jgi:hypothetical protein
MPLKCGCGPKHATTQAAPKLAPDEEAALPASCREQRSCPRPRRLRSARHGVRRWAGTKSSRQPVSPRLSRRTAGTDRAHRHRHAAGAAADAPTGPGRRSPRRTARGPRDRAGCVDVIGLTERPVKAEQRGTLVGRVTIHCAQHHQGWPTGQTPVAPSAQSLPQARVRIRVETETRVTCHRGTRPRPRDRPAPPCTHFERPNASDRRVRHEQPQAPAFAAPWIRSSTRSGVSGR